MFTGLIAELGRVVAVRRSRGVTRLTFDGPLVAGTVAVGDSVAVNGVCLTVTRRTARLFEADASDETRRVTTLAAWKPGGRVHLEPALRSGDPLGGHLVMGHVDGVGRLTSRAQLGSSIRLTFALEPRLGEMLVPKGSIAVDGVSLTLDDHPTREHFSVVVIPHTQEQTRLGRIGVGDRVNVEVDVLMKRSSAGLKPCADRSTGQPRVDRSTGRLTLEWIRTQGFAAEGR